MLAGRHAARKLQYRRTEWCCAALAVDGLAWLWTHAVTCALLNLSSFSSQKLSQVWFGEALAQ